MTNTRGKHLIETNSQRVGNLEKVDQYHLTSERCGNLSVWCAAMAGAEIIRKKAELGHGRGFTKWKKSRPFSASTADNYMALAKLLEARIKELPPEDMVGLLPAIGKAAKATVAGLQLLNLPSPMDVFNPAHDRISHMIRHLTGEKTLGQLYFDWGIIKPRTRLGGAREHEDKPLPPGETARHMTSIEAWTGILAEIHEQTGRHKSHLHLRIGELKRVSEALGSAKLKIDKLIEKG